MIEICLRKRTTILLATVAIITLSAQVPAADALVSESPGTPVGAPVRWVPPRAAAARVIPAQLDVPPAYLLDWGSYGTGDGEFTSPLMVAAHASGVVYVTDSLANRVQKFDTQGTFLDKWGSAGTAEGGFNVAWGVAVDSTGNVYVADNNNHRVQKFDSDGGFLRTWGFGVDDGTNVFQICTSGCQAGIGGFGAGQLYYPAGVAVDGADNVYVANFGSWTIMKFDSDGNYLFHFGDVGNAEGEFTSGPVGVAVDADRFIYTAEEGNYRVQVFNSAGDFVRMWGFGVQDGTNEFQVCTSGCQGGISGTGEGQFSRPHGVVVDARNDVYVVDADAGKRIEKFDRFGTFLCQWNQGNGSFNAPYAAAIQGTSFYLADTYNRRIVKFGGPYLETFVGEPDPE